MRLVAGGCLAGCVVVIAQGALGANLSASLKNFYAEYEVVLQCQEQAELTATDAETAKTAIAKIETHYLQLDSKINKERVRKAAVADKDEGFRIAARSGSSDLRPYCRVSLKELLEKAQEIDSSGKAQ
jgi:hypothetical protein